MALNQKIGSENRSQTDSQFDVLTGKWAKLGLLALLLFSCGDRDEKYIWEELSADSKSRIANANKIGCITDNNGQITQFSSASADFFNDVRAKDHYTFQKSDGTAYAELYVLYVADDTTNGRYVLFFYDYENNAGIDPIQTDDRVYKYYLADHTRHLVYNDDYAESNQDVVSQFCADTTNNTLTVSSTNLSYTIYEGTGSSSDATGLQITETTRTLTDAEPALFLVFNVNEAKRVQKDGEADDVKTPQTYKIVKNAAQAALGEAIKTGVENATKCEYLSDTKGLNDSTACAATFDIPTDIDWDL